MHRREVTWQERYLRDISPAIEVRSARRCIYLEAVQTAWLVSMDLGVSDCVALQKHDLLTYLLESQRHHIRISILFA